MTREDENCQHITFEQFSEEWLKEFRENNLSPFDKGRKFAVKLVSQWLGVTEDDEDLVLCDGTGDGGIDIAYLHRADIDDDNQEGQAVEGDTWYLIQSKYGTAFQGNNTIIEEGRKIVATVAGENTRLSEQVNQLVRRLDAFRKRASGRDRIILVFATERPMTESERQTLSDIRSIANQRILNMFDAEDILLANQRIPNMFDVEDISLQTIWETRDKAQMTSISLPIRGNFVDPNSGLRVGTIRLTDLYEFLKLYRDKTGNLDQLYEKNVRQFLGSRRKVNQGIEETLSDKPEMFGLYNNGITIVVSEFSSESDASCMLYDPYVVNGCQTTKTIWQVLQQKLEAGGTGRSESLENWRSRAERGVVVTKIVKSSSAEITEITKFTNSQNAVRAQDFIALRRDFKTWADSMAERHDLFLEIQRGGWESQKAFQNSHPTSRQYEKYANAFDLIKVYGAGWMREPGTAFGKNTPFLPAGTIFRRITSGEEVHFDTDDLYAAYRLKELAAQFNFGRGAREVSRRQTRYLFYFVVLDLLRDTLIRAHRPHAAGELTTALLILLREENQIALDGLTDSSLELLDEYLNRESEDSIYKEPRFLGDLNTFLKWEQLGKSAESTPCLNSLLAAHKRLFGRSTGGRSSPRNLVSEAVAG